MTTNSKPPSKPSSAMIDVYEFDLGGYPNANDIENGYGNGKTFVTKNLTPVPHARCGKIIMNNPPRASVDTKSCDLFNAEIEMVEPNAQMKLQQFDQLPQEFEFTIKLKNVKNENNEYIITATNLYNFVQAYGAKYVISHSELSTFNTSPLSIIYSFEFLDTILFLLYDAFKNDFLDSPKPIVSDHGQLDMLPDNTTYIKVMNPDINQKYVIIGDIHGSFSTLVRNLFRFKKMKIIDEDYIVKKNYNIVFLGDIIDRGNYSYECLIFISLLKIKNPKNVFINRGNHEEREISSENGFLNELRFKFKDDRRGEYKYKIIFTGIHDVLCKSHSAILLKDPITSRWIWLSHGGVPIINDEIPNANTNMQSFALTKNPNLHKCARDAMKYNANVVIPDIPDYSNLNRYTFLPARQIRWNDFTGKQTRANTIRTCEYIVGIDLIQKIYECGIKLIIRAHQDSVANTACLPFNKEITPISTFMGNLKMHKCSDYITTFYYDTNVFTFMNADTIEDRTTKQQTMLTVLPIITLSTNTDTGRGLVKDSFVIMDFMDNNDIYRIHDPYCKKPKSQIGGNGDDEMDPVNIAVQVGPLFNENIMVDGHTHHMHNMDYTHDMRDIHNMHHVDNNADNIKKTVSDENMYKKYHNKINKIINKYDK